MLKSELDGKKCYGGLDLATVSDIAAFVMYFPDDEHWVIPKFWVPEETAEYRQRKGRVPYKSWIDQGFICGTKGNVIDYDIIRKDINELGKQYQIAEIAVDRWNASQITIQLQGDGFEMVPFGQGFASLSAPTKELERLIIDKKLRHDGNPVLRWMASNAVAETDAAGNIKPSKKKSADKIDGVVALIMAIGRAGVRDTTPSVYENRGIFAL